ncbi:hypothetical protein KDC22_19855 [Paenibacillus tritici]|uniref:hypothetical protein n=1 Tax=Paenibacillus tritici TaxID=1873425 RepID=UPI001BA591F1|nr:hypothetical protein [Paenibacillus tritici]QUL52688.1 hypothetical protein KDC22_19855 [Paenibacillus tritici]
MHGMKYSIWIEAEQWAEGEWSIYDDNTDAIITFEDGSRWGASFFTYKNIQKLVAKNQQTGEYLQGKYFWGSDMVLVDECSRKRIEEVVEHLIRIGDFETIFKNYSSRKGDYRGQYKVDQSSNILEKRP